MLAARQLQIGSEYGSHTICISFMRPSRFIKQSTYENRKKTADKGHKNDAMRALSRFPCGILVRSIVRDAFEVSEIAYAPFSGL